MLGLFMLRDELSGAGGDLVFVEFADFQILRSAVERKAHEGAFFVYALSPCSAGVDVEHIVRFVVHDPQDMRMSGNKNVRPLGFEQRQKAFGVVSGIASDMSHDDFEVLASEQLALGDGVAQVPAVGIAVYGDGGLELSQFVKDSHANIASMPQFVAILEKGIDLWRNDAVSVGKNAYP